MGRELQIWNKQIVLDLLKEFPIACRVDLDGDRGGNWDLNPLYVEVDGTEDSLRITPFVDPQTTAEAPAENDDVPVCAIEILNLFGDSSGGCDTDSAVLGMVYGFLKARLVALGFNVIDHHDEIF